MSVIDLGLEIWLAAALIVALAGWVHGTLGLGFPVVATPLLALLLDVRLAILLTLMPTVTVNVASILRGGGWLDTLRRFWPLVTCALLGSMLGSQLIVILDPRPFKVVLAALILVYLALSRERSVSLPWINRHPGASMLAFGSLAGLAAGTTNVMVPVLIVYSLQLALPRQRMVQMFNLCFLAGKLSQIGTFAAAGLTTLPVLAATAGLAAIALASLRLGMRAGERVSRETFTRWVRRILGVLALLLLAQFASETWWHP